MTDERHAVACVRHLCDHHYDQDPVVEIARLKDENAELKRELSAAMWTLRTGGVEVTP